MTDVEKQEKLKNILYCLSTKELSKKDIDKYMLDFSEIYTDDFRHRYSVLLSQLYDIIKNNDTNDNIEHALLLISENLGVLYDSLNCKDDISDFVKKSFYKFKDHIELEIYKIQHEMSMPHSTNKGITFEKVNEMINNRFANLDELYDEFEKINKNHNELENKLNKFVPLAQDLEKSKVDVITALSIFSAIVLTFSGGISFLSGALNGMNDVTPYRLVFTISLTGMVIFNIIFMLLYIISRLLGKSISTNCKYLNYQNDFHPKIVKFSRSIKCDSVVCGYGRCNKSNNKLPMILCKLIHKYSYIISANIIMLIFMFFSFSMWYIDIGSERIQFNDWLDNLLRFLVAK